MINLTPSAIHEINRLQAQQSNRETIFRLGVKAGGCCQFFYTMAFDLPDDHRDEIQVLGDMQVAINQDQINYVEGLTIDYSEDLMGGGFRFNNPKATNTCSCGNSFAI
ncbi:MAG: HesB/IscA family protein [Microcoleaceae cyanobacterium]